MSEMPRQRTRRKFPEAFKRDAVDLVHTTGRPIAVVARELRIAPSTLRNWLRHEHIGRRQVASGTSDLHTDLVPALRRFLVEAQRASRDGLIDRSLPVFRFAQALAALPTRANADAAALAAAEAQGYAVARSNQGETRPAGRPLDADTLFRTGIAGLFRNGDADLDAVARDLAGYLSGPPVPIWEYAILDANLHLSGPIPVLNGWELFTPTADDLYALLPFLSTADQQPDPPFDAAKYGGLAMLRRPAPNDRPYIGFTINWPQPHPAHRLWQPLLALSLYDNPVVQLWARYRVEPGRRVDRHFDQVAWEIWFPPPPDDDVEVEVPMTGEFTVNRDGEPRLRRFLAAVAPLLQAATTQPDKTAARLQRCAEHFLSASKNAHGEGETLFDEYDADAVLHYVIALEGLIAGTDSDRQDFTRKVSQRAALLAGFNDTERLEFANVLRAAYDARSKYAHGAKPRKVALPALRRIVRRCLLARLILGDPTASGQTLADLTDDALLSHTDLERQISQPFEELRRQIDDTPQTRSGRVQSAAGP
jgi:transposase-like protein